jgi:N6-adenosine-specific RNA methylase IME4
MWLDDIDSSVANTGPTKVRPLFTGDSMETYRVIYADPPWRYDFSLSKSRRIENHYPTMTLEEICALKVPAADDAVLFLWTTNPKLREGLEVVKAWGFEYRTVLVWDKQIIGMGYWFRGRHELVLVATKGNFPPLPECLYTDSVISQRRTKHSKKPDAVRDLIAALFPEARKIELFAREKVAGWDAWGNEVESDVDLTKAQCNATLGNNAQATFPHTVAFSPM